MSDILRPVVQRATNDKMKTQEKVKPGTVGSCSARRTCEKQKMSGCSTLLRRITGVQMHIRRSRRRIGSTILARQVFPEGLTSSCRTDASNPNVKNCHCEFCRGTHLSCKNTSVSPDEIIWCGVKGKVFRRDLLRSMLPPFMCLIQTLKWFSFRSKTALVVLG